MDEKSQKNTEKKQGLMLSERKYRTYRKTQHVRILSDLHMYLRAVSKKKSIPMSKLLDTILSKMLVHGYHETESLCAHCGIVNKTKVSYSEFSLNKHERREIRKNHKIVLEIEV